VDPYRKPAKNRETFEQLEKLVQSQEEVIKLVRDSEEEVSIKDQKSGICNLRYSMLIYENLKKIIYRNGNSMTFTCQVD